MSTNSYYFDLLILNELIEIKNVYEKDFLKKVKTILKQKTTVKLWYEFVDYKEWDCRTRQYRQINFICCPQSRKAKNSFCLILETTGNKVSVIDGFLKSN